MKKSLVALLAGLAVMAMAASVMAAPAAEKPGESGFAEIPIGEEKQVGPYNVAAVYFQPVDMYPAGKNPSKEESDMHLEADIHMQEKYAVAYGFGAGEDIWPAYLTVKYEILEPKSKKIVMYGSFMPMNADDGPHYGANVKLPDADTYKVVFTFHNPEENGYLVHSDAETGPGGLLEDVWGDGPLTLEYKGWDYIPQEW